MQLPDYRLAKVLVIGDLMLDRYWQGATSRISPEAPVPVVHVQDIEERAGGAGNVALNIAALGAEVTVMGYCGRDEAGDSLIAALQQAGVHCVVERLPDLSTITKLRVLSRHQQLIRLDFEDGFHALSADALLEQFSEQLASCDAVVLSDYGKGTLQAATRLIEMANRAGKPVLVDPKGEDFSIYQGATLITPNLHEFEAISGSSQDEAVLLVNAEKMLADLSLHALLVTRGEQGMSLIMDDSEPLHLPTQAREVYDVTGAGDTVISVLAASLAAGKSLADATKLANLAAGVVVGKLGTATISAAELGDALLQQRALHRGVIELELLQESLALARLKGEAVVATNGCFDILHPGHIHYLQQARQLGDRLVVLVNSDASVSRLKGPERPINPLAQRMAMLAALACVDWVISFDSDTPESLICSILPDLLVKGGDYPDIKAIAGYACVVNNGGEVRVLDFVDGFSTTNFIQGIRNA